MIRFEHRVDLRLQLGTQRGRETFQLEIDPGIVRTDLDAGDPAVVIAQSDRIEHVQDGVIACEHETTIAVYREMHRLSDQVRRERRSCCVPDHIVRVGLCGFDRQRGAIVQPDEAGVGRLATAAGVEAGAIESGGVVAHSDDDRVALEAVIVVEIEPCGGMHRSPRRNGAPRSIARPEDSARIGGRLPGASL
jgi:hypothetical protein